MAIILANIYNAKLTLLNDPPDLLNNMDGGYSATDLMTLRLTSTVTAHTHLGRDQDNVIILN